LPGHQFLNWQEPAIYSGNDFGFAPNNPALYVGSGKIIERELFAKRADHMIGSDILVFEHRYSQPSGWTPAAPLIFAMALRFV
jgi:hypothetical protein